MRYCATVCCVGIFLVSAALTQGAMTFAISEVLTGAADCDAGAIPKYIEVYASSDSNETHVAFDVVVVDASVGLGTTWDVLSVAHLTTVADADTYIVADSAYDWLIDKPSEDQRVVASLNLGLSSAAARTIIVFDHATNLVPPVSRAADVLAEGGVADVLTYKMTTKWPISAVSFNGETVQTISHGDALFRVPDGDGSTDQWVAGPIDAQMNLTSQAQLNPGWANELIGVVSTESAPASATVPEPISAAGWSVWMIVLMRRRYRGAAATCR